MAPYCRSRKFGPTDFDPLGIAVASGPCGEPPCIYSQLSAQDLIKSGLERNMLSHCEPHSQSALLQISRVWSDRHRPSCFCRSPRPGCEPPCICSQLSAQDLIKSGLERNMLSHCEPHSQGA